MQKKKFFPFSFQFKKKKKKKHTLNKFRKDLRILMDVKVLRNQLLLFFSYGK